MQPIRIYLNGKDEALVACQACGKRIKLKIREGKFPTRPVKVTCGCRCTQEFILERRSCYRQPLRLSGVYFQEDSADTAKQMVVENISMNGLGFSTLLQSPLQPEEVVRVQFRLDNDDRSLIDRTGAVKYVKGRYVGVEFRDNKKDKALWAYLKR